jgi:ATP-dependent RNA helicase DDX43
LLGVIDLFLIFFVSFQTAVHSVAQKIMFVDGENVEDQKKAMLLEFIENLQPGEKAMVFVGKKAKVDDLCSDFVLQGINCQVC